MYGYPGRQVVVHNNADNRFDADGISKEGYDDAGRKIEETNATRAHRENQRNLQRQLQAQQAAVEKKNAGNTL